MKAFKPSKKLCAHKPCGKPFMTEKPMQVVCGPYCGVARAREKAAKKRATEAAQVAKIERQKHREDKERIKTRREYLSEAQAVINRYVRLRDYRLGCISCDKPASWSGQWHASHFRTVGAAGHLRFNLWNIHKACSICNNHLSGNIIEYRPRLAEKIGPDRVRWLEEANWIERSDIEYLKRLKKVFSKKCRHLQKRLS